MTTLRDSDRVKNVVGDDYVLRISTPYCNLKCSYCRKDDFNIEPISDDELIDIVKAGAECGIKRVRWTGGEPTVKPNYVGIVKRTRDAGIESQMLSTNGIILYKMAKELKDSGVDRVNISMDTVDRKRFYEITGRDMLHNVLESIDVATEIFDLVKLNRVLEKSNFEETIPSIEFTQKYQWKKAPPVIRFIELIKGGFKGDAEYVNRGFCSGEKVVELIRDNYGHLTKVEVEGDNPMCYYYKIDNNNVVFGIIPHFSVNFQCGGKKCKKLRVNPTGFISNCSIYQEFGHELKGTTYKEKLDVMRHLIIEKQERREETFKKLKHFQSDYQFWRFGKPRESDVEGESEFDV